MKYIEVEIKFPLLNSDAILKKMNDLVESNEQYQKDTYFNSAHRDFLSKDPICEWLRIRETKDKATINYKNWHDVKEEHTVSCDEFETKINDVEALKKIFEKLNFKELITVEKLRITFEYKDVEIAIDNVTGLGFFIELEAKGDFDNIDVAREHLYKIMSELNVEVGEQDFRGYPYRLLDKKGYFN